MLPYLVGPDAITYVEALTAFRNVFRDEIMEP
jgi:hypothetical protein